MYFRHASLALLFSLSLTAAAAAQSVAVDVHVASSSWSEFDGTDGGVGGRVSVKPLPMIGIDADLTWYPSDFPSGKVASFSGQRFEGLFGATIGPKLGRMRPFVKMGGGFVNVGDTPKAYACVAIFPPPLSCTLAGGETLPAWEFGGGIEIDATSKAFFRADLSDRLLKYPGVTLDSKFQRHDDAYYGGAVRFTIGAGLRF